MVNRRATAYFHRLLRARTMVFGELSLLTALSNDLGYVSSPVCGQVELAHSALATF